MTNDILTEPPAVLYQNRYCEQINFNLIISGIDETEGKVRMYDRIGSIYQVDYPDFSNVDKLYSSKVFSDLEIQLTCGSRFWSICFREILKASSALQSETYLAKYGVWNNLIERPDVRVGYCICSFMRDLYVFGGWYAHEQRNRRTCFKYNSTTKKWLKMTNLKVGRNCASCSVFEGKIVVSGGYNTGNLKSVEAYDYHENKWTCSPDMINKRACHGQVSMGNKLFVLGGFYEFTCEVFDSISRKFTSLNKIVKPEECGCAMSAVCIGYKIIIFPRSPRQYYSKTKKFFIYDVLMDQCNLKENKLVYLEVSSCLRVPML